MMKIEQFIDLIKSGFDVSFNYNDVFYTISIIDENEQKKYGLGGDNGFSVDFYSLDEIENYVLDGEKISKIISTLKDDDIFY